MIAIVVYNTIIVYIYSYSKQAIIIIVVKVVPKKCCFGSLLLLLLLCYDVASLAENFTSMYFYALFEQPARYSHCRQQVGAAGTAGTFLCCCFPLV